MLFGSVVDVTHPTSPLLIVIQRYKHVCMYPCVISIYTVIHVSHLAASYTIYSSGWLGSTPVLEQVLPQASTICVTTISRDGRSLAVGLASGVVIIWDLKTS